MDDRLIALLRGVNVGGHNKVPMTDLRSLCTQLGWADVQTYIQSGNILFHAKGEPAALEKTLEMAIRDRMGFKIPVIVRTAADWAGYILANPFPGASEREPNFVHLLLSKFSPDPGAVEALQERAQGGERVALAAGALWVHYASGAGRSKLAPALLDRLAGSPVTGRNWRTVLKVDEMLGSPRRSH
ncbi:MAG TPA: DUF1697 domain-containing protein [Anaerolineales bacterium]|nr:DUF1697 domain-containing protein [Anaerolineales bacterium]